MTIDNQYVEIVSMNKIGSDVRGETFTFSSRDNVDHIFFTRKKGTLSGNTYHEGRSKNTNPKIFVLISGQIEFKYRKIGKDVVYSESISEPCIIKVQPMVTHSIYAISDCYILECNSISDIEHDRVREEVVLTS